MATKELVSLDKDYEVRHWLRTFMCTEAQLFEAVRTVGPEVTDVLAYIDAKFGPAERMRFKNESL